MAPGLAAGPVSACYFSFPGPCKFGAKPEVAVASLAGSTVLVRTEKALDLLHAAALV